MTKNKIIPPIYMSVGKVAKKMGVTVRTLQYYDREGLFCPSLISDNGRRLYNDNDLIKLHQILSFKSLGFTLDEIRKTVTKCDSPIKVADALNAQINILQNKIDSLSTSLHTIETLKNEVLKMQTVDFNKYADIIINLQMGNDSFWLIKYFNDDMLDYLHKKFDKDSGLTFLNKYNKLIDKAIDYESKNILPSSKLGQTFAGDFWSLINDFLGKDMSKLNDLMKFVEIESDNENWKQTQLVIKNFIEPALGFYFESMEKNNGICN